jgi:hypothetical protein
LHTAPLKEGERSSSSVNPKIANLFVVSLIVLQWALVVYLIVRAIGAAEKL